MPSDCFTLSGTARALLAKTGRFSIQTQTSIHSNSVRVVMWQEDFPSGGKK